MRAYRIVTEPSVCESTDDFVLLMAARKNIVNEIHSGGQTGVDRGALDAALELGISTSGYVPLGRLAEDGRITDDYPGLIETSVDDPSVRTMMNVGSTDGTLFISRGNLIGGSAFTLECAKALGKPVIHIDLSVVELAKAAAVVDRWLTDNGIRVLNVAGPRASEDPMIYESAKELIRAALTKNEKGGTRPPFTFN